MSLPYKFVGRGSDRGPVGSGPRRNEGLIQEVRSETRGHFPATVPEGVLDYAPCVLVSCGRYLHLKWGEGCTPESREMDLILETLVLPLSVERT